VGVSGLHPILFLQSLADNIITRFLGAIVRSVLIATALFLESIFFFVGIFWLTLWLIFTVTLIFGLVNLFFWNFGELTAWPIFLAMVFFGSLVVPVVSFRVFQLEKKDYYSMELFQLGTEKWFERVWNRIGLDKRDAQAAWLEDLEILREKLNEADISLEEFLKIVSLEISNQEESREKRRIFSRGNLFSSLPIGKNWVYAYTAKLDKYSDDLSEGDYSQYRSAKLFGKERDLEELCLALSKPAQNSVIIIGESGVGRGTIIHSLAQKIRSNQIGEPLNSKRVLELDLKEVLSGSNYEESEEILHLMFREAAYAGNVILVIKNIHEFLGGDSGKTRDIASVLSEYLHYPTFQIIATTIPGEFHSKVEKKEAIMKYCDRIWIEEMKKDDVMGVLLHKLKEMETGGVRMTYQALREIIDLADRYVSDSPFPEKALDLMDDVVLHWQSNGSVGFISKEVVDQAVSSKMKIPLGEMSQGESDRMLNLEEILHQRVIGQDMAVKQIAETVRKTRIGMSQKDKPLGSFLFLGPTGVGKTESAKALAQAYFGDENRMIRLDMSEYQTQNSIDRIIGSASSREEGYLVSKVKESPYSLLLLDEIEKAYPEILNLFLQVLDEGYLRDAFGKKISFKNLIIIATSNAGSDIIKNNIQKGNSSDKTMSELIDYVVKEGIFRPEFINRFEGVVFFHPLSPMDISKVSRLMLEKYSLRIKEQKNIQIVFREGVAEKVAKSAYDPVFGARAINRFIADKIEDELVKKIIAGEIRPGMSYVFKPEDLEE
jgi:ATP-dependent Clp protease ATP-binding subunit ClpC